MTRRAPPAGDAGGLPQWRWRFTVPAVLAVVGLAGALYFVLAYAPRVRQQALDRLEHELSLRVDDLGDVLDTTLAEDHADLATIAAFPSTVAAVSRTPRPDEEGIGGPRHLARIFEGFAERQAFERIAVTGPDGALQVSAGRGVFSEVCLAAGRETTRTGDGVVTPHLHGDGQLQIAVAVPIADTTGQIRGAVVGEYPARARLCRGLLSAAQASPVMSATLAARSGDHLLHICDPQAAGEPPRAHDVRALESPVFAAAAAMSGNSGFRRGRDVHGRVVYATGRRLARQPWDVVVKVHADRVDAAVRDDLAQTGAMWTASFLAVGALVVASWRERERAHQLSRARERARLSLLIDHAADPMIVVDEQGRIREFNRRAPEFYGIEPGALMGQQIGDQHHPERRGLPRPGKAGDAGDPDMVLYETTHRAAGGREVPVEISSRRVVLDGETLHVAVIRDISAQRRLQAQFLQAQKMEGIGRLAGGVAHDFNNLLTAIMGYAELLQQEISDETLRGYVEEITKAGSRATALTTQLLTFARRQVVEPRLVDVNALVNDAQKMLQRLVGEDVTITTRLEPDVGAVRADSGQLQQVLVNLVVNARDAMPSGGRITIATRSVRHEGGEAPLVDVEMAVTDTGEGIAPDVRAHLFEPFFTTKPQGKGTGLGLATCHGIVTQGGGTIEVESEQGAGTTVRVRLPRVAAQAEAGGRDRATPLRGGRETILVVEDEAAVRSLAALGLQAQGYTVLEAADGHAALELNATSHEIDLLVTDVVMPGIDGRELAARLRVTRPRTRVLFISGHTEDAILRRGVLDAGIDFLYKPFAPEQLARRVREILDRPGDDRPPPGEPGDPA